MIENKDFDKLANLITENEKNKLNKLIQKYKKFNISIIDIRTILIATYYSEYSDLIKTLSNYFMSIEPLRLQKLNDKILNTLQNEILAIIKNDEIEVQELRNAMYFEIVFNIYAENQKNKLKIFKDSSKAAIMRQAIRDYKTLCKKDNQNLKIIN